MLLPRNDDTLHAELSLLRAHLDEQRAECAALRRRIDAALELLGAYREGAPMPTHAQLIEALT